MIDEGVRFTSEVQHLLLWQMVWARDIDTLICGNAARFAIFLPKAAQWVRGTVEEALNAMLGAEAERLCGASRYERSQVR